MTAQDIIFYLLAAFTLVTGFLAVTTTKIFRSAIFLLFSLIGIAGIYFWLEYEFIAAVQIVVYVGGIVVLIIFSIFLTQEAGSNLPDTKMSKKITGGLAAVFGFGFTLLQVLQHKFIGTTEPGIEPNVANIGNRMLGVNEFGYSLPFEVVSILLLAAMIGCIVIALKKPVEK
ncbi:MAG: NADH-quinone oxidoreductase subunit J [Bacteroidia bacterium]